MMNKTLSSVIAFLMALILCLTSLTGTVSAADVMGETGITSTDMSFADTKSNLEGFYSDDEWKENCPDGLFVVEYSSYEIGEGGTDPQNPEDCYLGITVYRLGGNSRSSELTYNLTLVSGNSEVYPDSQGKIFFEPQQTKATAKIKVHNDNVRGGDQLLTFALTDCTSGIISDAFTAAVKIYDDEPYVQSVISMTVENTVTDMQEGHVKVTLKRSENTVDYCTLKITTTDGTAKAGAHYEAVEETILFSPNQDTREVIIPLVQSDEKFTQAKSFKVTISELKGCVADNTTELRLDITNKLPEGKPLLTDTQMNADLALDSSQALADSAVSIVNVNDHVDRKKLILSAVGAANGSASIAAPADDLIAASDTSNWTGNVKLKGSDFEMLFCSDEDSSWNGQSFSNGNEDLLLATNAIFDLNLFSSITFKFKNKENLANGNPNTAFGYMIAGGASDSSRNTGFVDHSLKNAENWEMNKMHSIDRYFLYNAKNKNVDAMDKGVTESFNKSAKERFVYTSGLDAHNMKMFVMLYDDDGWDDHYFSFGEFILNRTVIPFSAFNVPEDGVTNFEVSHDPNGNHSDSKVTFIKDSFIWTISLTGTGGGGIGETGKSTDDISEKYGFFVGSKLKITATPAQEGQGTITPEYVYFADSKGYVHNAAQISSEGQAAFYIKLESVQSNSKSELMNSYFMTEQEAVDHIKHTLGDGGINSCYTDKIHINTRYSINQGVSVNFANVPSLITRQTGETETEHKNRVYNVLKDVLTFYDTEDNTFVPDYEVNFVKKALQYDAYEFDRMVVSPGNAGGGYKASSNLLNLDYQNFGDTRTISSEDCSQIKGGVVVTLFPDSVDYLIPSITTESFSVAQKTEGNFETIYNANLLDDYIPFEVMYPDTGDSPAPYYYKAIVSISDIYAAGMNGESKDFTVDVKYATTDNTDSYTLFSFTFKGGSPFEKAKELDIRNISDKFSQANDFMPYAELLSTVNGFRYAIYIPSYYNYQNENAADYTKYKQIFLGADGIGIEIHNFDKNTGNLTDFSESDDGETEVISTLDISSTQYVCTKIPEMDFTADDERMETLYLEQQDDFYTYTDHTFKLDLSGMTVDLSGLMSALGKVTAAKLKDKVGAGALLSIPAYGAYVKLGNNNIIVGLKFGINGLKAYDTHKGSKDETYKPKSVMWKETAPVSADPATPKKNAASKQGSDYNSGFAGVSITGGVDFRVQLNYDTHTHQYYFASFTAALNFNVGASVTVPIPPTLNLVYGVFGLSSTLSVSTGFKQVSSYVDQSGKVHHKISWNGVNISPVLSGSIGIGFGLSTILAVEFGGSFDLSGSFTFGTQNHVGPQKQYDFFKGFASLDKDPSHTNYEISGDAWRTVSTMDAGDDSYGEAGYDSQFYNNTVLQSTHVGDSLKISFTGTSFILKASKNSTGGMMKVTVKDEKDKVLKSKTVDLKTTSESKDSALPYMAFVWETADYTSAENMDVTVTIEHISRSNPNSTATGFEGDNITLDSFLVYNNDFSAASSWTYASIDQLALKLSVFLKFVVIGFSINLEPGYMLIKWNGVSHNSVTGQSEADKWAITLGTVAYSHTWSFDGTEVVSSTSSRPVRLASANSVDYFDLGEYANNKSQAVLQSNIKNSSDTQVISHNGDIYTFYTALVIEDDATSFYQLYYSVNGVDCGKVTEEIFVGDFNAFVTDDGKLAVAMTGADSTVTAMVRDGSFGGAVMKTTDNGGTDYIIDGTDDLSQVLQRTAVKVTTFDENTKKFTNSNTIKATDSDFTQQYMPVAVSSQDGSSVLLYVNDKKTEIAAQHKLNWEAYNEDSAKTAETITDLMNSMHSGQAELVYTVFRDGEVKKTASVPLDEVISAKLKAGYKITSMDAVMCDSDTFAVAYSAEIPYSVVSGRTGTLKEIHYLTGDIASDGSVTFSKTVVVDSRFDFDEDTDKVFDGADEVPSIYYNESTGEYYNEIILQNVQLENTVVCKNGEDVTASQATPTLFYHTNASVNYVDYNNLELAVNAVNSGTDSEAVTGVLYDGHLDDYIVAVSEEGNINLIFNDTSRGDSAFTDTLCVVEYNAQDKVWNKPRTLTYSDAFSQEAYDSRKETGSVSFEDYSALVDEKGNIALALKSSYVPFTYEYGTTIDLLNSDDPNLYAYYDGTYVDENGETKPFITTPMLDYSSDKARTDISLITFSDPVIAVDVAQFDLDNEVLTAGENITVEYTIDNMGDRALEDMYVALYFTDESGAMYDEVVHEELSGMLLAGDGYEGTMEFTLTKTPEPGSILCMQITDYYGTTVYYDSLVDSYNVHKDNPDSDKLQVYRVVEDLPELRVNGAKVRIDENGIMSFTVGVENAGTEPAGVSPRISCNIYNLDEDNVPVFNRTLFSFTVDKEELEEGSVAYFSDKFNVKDYLQDSSLYYAFEINTVEEQITTNNDSTEVFLCKEEPKVTLDSISLEDMVSGPSQQQSNMVRFAMLGQEIRFEPNLLSSGYDLSDLRVYEIGSDCLSISNPQEDGSVKVKVLSLPEKGEGFVRLLFSIRGTSIYKMIYLNLTDSKFINFTKSIKSEGFEITNQDYVYADNFDLATTEKDESTISFSFTGNKLRLYGNQLTNGGDFTVTVKNSAGKEIVRKTVSTASELNNYGMLLYMSDTLELGLYNVTITAHIDEGEKLALDGAKCTVDLRDADTTPYYQVQSFEETLDAPLLRGRTRSAFFTLNFSSNVALCDGKTFEDITLDFAEYEDGKPTGNTVTFKGVDIKDGKSLVLGTELTSKAGAVLTYILEDSNIPEGVIVTENGTAVNTAIPDYNSVSYELKESGIMSVTVAKDEEMPDGSVHKSVRVRFVTQPEESRLEGTKLLYRTTDPDGTVREVEFKYISLTADNRTAIYRADSLTLAKEEITKTFSFEEGIVLNDQNYVLVTADGDYLENDITTVISDKTTLDITYNKLKSEYVPYIEMITDSKSSSSPVCTPAVFVFFDEAVDISQVIEDKSAYVTVLEEIRDMTTGEVKTRELDLFIHTITTQNEVLCFRAKENTDYGMNKEVTYTLISKEIEYTGDKEITAQADKISINPALMDTEKLTFNTGAYIANSELYLKGGQLTGTGNTLCADLTFSTQVDESTLTGTTVEVTQYISEYDLSTTEKLTLEFDCVKTIEGEFGFASLATYKCKEDVSLEYQQVSKILEIMPELIVPEGKNVTSKDGEYIFGKAILYRPLLEVSRLKAEDAEFELVSKGDMGYSLVLDVMFEDEIKAETLAGVYTKVYMTAGDTTTEVYLTAESAQGNKLRFVSNSAVTLPADCVVEFTLPERFSDVNSLVTNSNGVGVCEEIADLAEYTYDTTGRGVVESATLITESISLDETQLVAEVKFNESLAEKSFADTSLQAVQTITYADGSVNNVTVTLKFAGFSDEFTAVYKAAANIPEDSAGCSFALVSEIKSSGELYTKDKLIVLDTALPESTEKVTLKKAQAVDSAVAGNEGTGKISNIGDTFVAIAFDSDIFAKNLEGITLEAKVKGIDGVDTVMYKAESIAGDKTLILVTDSIDAKYANIIEVSLENTRLIISEDSALYTENGLVVSTSVPNASTKFINSEQGDVPVPTEPSSTAPATDISTLPETVPTEGETSAATEPDTTKATQETTESGSNSGALTTGQQSCIWMAAVFMMIASALIIIMLRRRIRQ